MKIVIYTCIVNNYDTPLNVQRLVAQNKADFVCFTDNAKTKEDGWEYRKIDTVIEGKYKYPKTNRHVKLNPHLYLNGYDINVYIDGNKRIKDFNKLIDLCHLLHNTDANIVLSHHWGRSMIVAEIAECIRLGRDDKEVLVNQLKDYILDGFKDTTGLYMGSIQIRKFNEEMRVFMEAWWNEVEKHSYRDQVSLPYVIWKTGMYPKMIRLYPNYVHELVEHHNHLKQFNGGI